MKKKIIFIALFLLIIDIVTKLFIDNIFNLMESREIIKKFFSITKVYNYGASWSILTGYRYILIIIAIIILFLLFNYQKKFILNTRNVIAFSLLYSGILGNLIDRIIHGYVIDFLDFKILNYDYPVFNFADIYIVIGIVFLIIAVLKKEDESGIKS